VAVATQHSGFLIDFPLLDLVLVCLGGASCSLTAADPGLPKLVPLTIRGRCTRFDQGEVGEEVVLLARGGDAEDVE